MPRSGWLLASAVAAVAAAVVPPSHWRDGRGVQEVAARVTRMAELAAASPGTSHAAYNLRMLERVVTARAKAATPLYTSSAGAAGGGTVSATDCDTCQAVVATLDAIAVNATSLNEFVKGLDVACQVVFPNNATDLAVCYDVVNATAAFLPWVDSQLRTLDWDIPLAFCSVFVPVCQTPCCSTPAVPEQLHLSLTGTLSEMAITWVTLNQTATSLVQWQVAGNASSLTTAPAVSVRTYTVGGWLGVVHSAVMTHLTPSTTYTYRVGDASTNNWSAWWNFTTFPTTIGTAGRPLRVLQIGDMGFESVSDDTVADMTALVDAGQVDFVMHSGDIGYADGDMPHWDIFMNKVQPVAARVPYMTVAGNHELWYNFTAYKTRYYMPSYQATTSMYYSFDLPNGIHWTCINTETALDTADLDPVQAAWLQADLAGAAGATWRIVTGHRPFYCSDHDKTQCGLFAWVLRFQGEQILHDNHVDLVITAHEHGWERTYPTFNSTPTSTSYASPTAPVYIVSGAGGNREGNELPAGGESWSAFQSAAVGYALLTIDPTSLNVQFFASNGSVLVDQFTITK